MAQPPLQLPPHGSQDPSATQLLQPLLLPKYFSPQGSANLYPLAAQEQPFQAAWAPQLQAAPPAPQAPPAGLQRAPCGCFFDPRVFRMPWMIPNPPPPDTSMLGHGTTPAQGAVLWGPRGRRTPLACGAPGTPQGPPQHLTPYDHQGRAMAPAPLVLQTSIPSNQHIAGQSAGVTSTGTATPVWSPLGSDIAPGSNIALGSDVPPRPGAAPHDQALGDPADEIEVTEQILLEEALRLFGCSLEALGDSQDRPSSSPMPGNPGDTSSEARAVAPTPPMLPVSMPGFEHTEAQSAESTITSTATPAGASSGSDIALGSDAPPRPWAAPHKQALLDLANDPVMPQVGTPEDALCLFDCSLDAVGDGPTSSRMPGDPGDSGPAGPIHDFAWLSLPEELLTPDYSVPETADAILSLDEFVMSLEHQESLGDAWLDLAPSQPAKSQKRGGSPLPTPPRKRKALAGSVRVPGGD